MLSEVANTANLLGNPDSSGPYGGVMRRYPPSLWDTVRAAIGCAAVLAVVLLGGVGLYLIAPYVFEWIGYVTCYVQQLLGGECTPVLPTVLQD